MSPELRRSSLVYAIAMWRVFGTIQVLRAHAETSIEGKWDPGYASGKTIDMNAFRAEAVLLAEEGDMALNFDRDYPVFLRMLDTYIRYSSRTKGARPTWEDGPTMLEQLAVIREQVGAIAARPVADVDEAALAAELEKRGVGGASPAEVKAAMIAVLRHGTEGGQA